MKPAMSQFATGADYQKALREWYETRIVELSGKLEAVIAERDTLQLENARVRQETIEECAKVVENTPVVQHRNFERTDDAYGTLDAAASALRSLPPAAKINESSVSNNSNNCDSVHLAVDLAGIPSLPSNGSVPDDFREVMTALFYELEKREGSRGNAPGHGHEIPGIWDSDNIKSGLAGKPCAWCALWNKAKAMVAEQPTTGPMLRSTRQDAHDEGRTDEQKGSSCPPSSAQGNVPDDLRTQALNAIQWFYRRAEPVYGKLQFAEDAIAALQSAAPIAEREANLNTMDAKVWTDEFCRINPCADWGTMMAWFSNAIMAGFDEATRRAALSAPAIPTWQPIETAPKDGSLFIGLRGSYVARTRYGRHYVKFPHEPEGPTYRDVWNEVGRDFIAPWEPSHWTPIPMLAAAQIPASPKNHSENLDSGKTDSPSLPIA